MKDVDTDDTLREVGLKLRSEGLRIRKLNYYLLN